VLIEYQAQVASTIISESTPVADLHTPQKMSENVSNLKNTSIGYMPLSTALLVTYKSEQESSQPNP
jgi:hypothetical protein